MSSSSRPAGGSTARTPGISRRDMLALALSAAAITTVPRLARAATATVTAATAAAKPGDVRFTRLIASFADEILALAPSTATSLGRDSGPHAGLKSQLEDVSPAGDARWSRQVRTMVTRLAALDRTSLSPAAQVRYDSILYSANAGIAGDRFSFGGAASGFYGSAAPYPVTQQNGAIATVPEFLAAQHQVKTAADAEAYLARLAALAPMLDQESARIAEQADKGITPPDFIAKNALGRLQQFRATPAAQQSLVTSLTERTQQLGIAGDWQGRATKLVSNAVYPALDRQIAAFSKATANATDVPGVHRLPDGAAYYQWALNLGTSTTYTAAEIHAAGLAQLEELGARIDTIMRGQGLTEGSLIQRLGKLLSDPNVYFPDSDAGRAELIAYCNKKVDAIRLLMPKMSHMKLKAPLQIKRVPQDIEDGTPLGYMNFASLDGTRPAIYYINLKAMAYWPKAALSTLTAHEGLPGHAWQGAYLAEHQAEIPLIASLTNYNAFIEGWGLYAEQLVDENGLYANDPFSQIGYLLGQQFRTCRLVVDTGLHAMQWTRQQAIQFLVAHGCGGVAGMTVEVDRYTVSPGQACGYKIGHNEILKQRARAKAALGERFDVAAYNDALVQSTGVPLTVLPTVVDHFIAASRG